MTSGVEENRPADPVLVAEAPGERKVEAPYWLRHWRGDLPLWQSFWCNLVLGLLLLRAALAFVSAPFAESSEKFIASIWLFSTTSTLLVSGWQIVGAWRSVKKYQATRWGYAPAECARGIVAIYSLGLLSWTVLTVLPGGMDCFSIIAGNQRVPPFEIRATSNRRAVVFVGGLRTGASKALERILESAPQAKTLVLDSTGGRIDEALLMAYLVRKHHLNTETTTMCASAATLVLIAGKERSVREGARVGFHQAHPLIGSSADRQKKIDALLRAQMRSAGIADWFIRRVLSTPSTKMWFPTAEELVRGGVITSE